MQQGDDMSRTLHGLQDTELLAPWRAWMQDGSQPGLGSWLEHLEAELPAHVEHCREEERRLATLWQHMVPKLDQFLPDEIAHVVSAQLDASARRGAAEALCDMVQLERARLDGLQPATQGHAVDEPTLRRLLDGITADRATIGRALTGEVLETLCSIALDLEVTERRLGDAGGSITETLADLREHVIAAANMLRALPGQGSTQPRAHEPASAAVARCLARYNATLETGVDWQGDDPEQAESTAALLWVVEEVMHHLHGCTAGRMALRVDARHGVRATLWTPSPALSMTDTEPDWMLRSRLRLQLAEGSIGAVRVASGSCVEVLLP
jgi:hypothetical protein